MWRRVVGGVFSFVVLTALGLCFYFYRLAAAYRETTFCLIVTSDLGTHSALMPQAATVVASAARSCEGPVVIADNGGLFLFDTSEALVRASGNLVVPEARYLAVAGYRFLNVTPDLFRLGTPTLRRLIHEAGVEVITANMEGGGSKMALLGDMLVGIHGLTVSDAAHLMPAALFEEMRFRDPFEEETRNPPSQPADINVVLLNADPLAFSGKQGIDPSDVLSAIHSRFPHAAVVVTNSAFPPKLLSEAGGSTFFAYLDRHQPTFFFAEVKMIRHRNDKRAVVSSIKPAFLSFDTASPNATLRDIFLSFREEIGRRSAEVVGVPWFELDLTSSRKSDSPTHRFFHETLLAIAGEAGVEPEVSVAAVPQATFRHPPGAPVTVSDMRTLFPDDRFPFVVTVSGERLVELMQKAMEQSPDAAPSLFPFTYVVSRESIRVSDQRFSPERRYVAVFDGRFGDLLPLIGEAEGSVFPVKVLPDRPASFLMRRFPAKLSRIFSPLWRME